MHRGKEGSTDKNKEMEEEMDRERRRRPWTQSLWRNTRSSRSWKQLEEHVLDNPTNTR
jgi:hypothetical protein